MNDLELRKSVQEELEFEPSIDAANIGISAHKGVVTLDGYVSSYPQKLAAEYAAWRVKGVKAIAEEIEVRLPSNSIRHDDEIARRAMQSLSWNTLLIGQKIKAMVSDGWVTLSGEVGWNYERFASESQVLKLEGVKGVINNITIKHAPQPADIRTRITDALKRHADVEASQITIDVQGNTVALAGTVDDWSERRAVRRAAWSAPGVLSVEDSIRIV